MTTSAAVSELSLRERKKRRTRATIARVALELFDRQGFAQTTIPQIAEAADVSPRTVSAYFPVKEELAFPDREEFLGTLQSRIRQREAGTMTLEVLRAWIADEIPSWDARDAEMRCRRKVVESDDALRAYERAMLAEVQAVLEDGIARDLGCAPGDLPARMAAAATTAVLDVLGEHYQPLTHAEVDVEDLLREVDQAVRFVAAGIRALRER